MPIFDRFVRYEWAERALELAVQQEPAFFLKDWLERRGLGKESARRTYNTLLHLWLSTPLSAEKRKTREDAIRLFPSLASEERRVLHWGMALAQFPLFYETAQIVGRMGRFQSECAKSEIISRVLEKYSNQTTIRRAVERILQTMKDWSVLTESRKGFYALAESRVVQSAPLAEWLFYALLSFNSEKYWLLHDLLNAAEIFPFDLSAHYLILRQSRRLTIERDSFGEEIIGILPQKIIV